MAHDPELKNSYRGLEAGEVEMAQYRANLAAKLAAERNARSWRWSWMLVPLAAALLLAFYLWPTHQNFPQHSHLEALENLAREHPRPQQLLADAEVALARGEGIQKGNAALILCLLKPEGEAIQAASSGLLNDPRPKLRSFFLEYLLDHADEYQLNQALIERKMDEEEDELCLALYRRLLWLSES